MAVGYVSHLAGNNTRLFDDLSNTSRLPVPDVMNDHQGIRLLALVSVKIIKTKINLYMLNNNYVNMLPFSMSQIKVSKDFN